MQPVYIPEGKWVKIKLNEKDANGKDVWKGQVENISDNVLTVNDGKEPGYTHKAHAISWDLIKECNILGSAETHTYYTGPEFTVDDLLKAIYSQFTNLMDKNDE